jgi:hypothetical protein
LAANQKIKNNQVKFKIKGCNCGMHLYGKSLTRTYHPLQNLPARTEFANYAEIFMAFDPKKLSD